jgi:hypothetical protein
LARNAIQSQSPIVALDHAARHRFSIDRDQRDNVRDCNRSRIDTPRRFWRLPEGTTLTLPQHGQQ